MPVTIVCECCKAEFQGRPNRRTCSVGCRRQLEMLRRDWDRRAARLRFFQTQANAERHSAKQRAAYQAEADAEAARLGARP